MSDDLEMTVESARFKFSRAVREYKKVHRVYIDYAQTLPQYLLDNCRVFSDRLQMLSSGIFPVDGVWAEVGVDLALFSREIIEKTKPLKIHLLDIDIARIDMANISNAVSNGTAIIHEGDSSTILRSFDDEYFDVVYVDGDHYYEGVKKDIDAARHKIKSGGYMVFNDYTSWSPGSMSKCGVAKAANEFVLEEKWNVVAIALQGSGYYDLAIQKPYL